jgi:hypothetical protein
MTPEAEIMAYLAEIQMSTFTLAHLTGIPKKKLDAMLANGNMKIEPYRKICRALRVDTDKFCTPILPK